MNAITSIQYGRGHPALELSDALTEIGDWLDNRADCDGDSCGTYPNAEMQMMCRLNEGLEAWPIGGES